MGYEYAKGMALLAEEHAEGIWGVLRHILWR